MKTAVALCTLAAVLILGVGVLWPNETNACNISRLPSFSGKVETAARKTVHNTETCWIIRVRDPHTGTLYRVPFKTEEDALKHPTGSTYSR